MKGGISLHVKNEDSVENLVKKWPQKAFGGNTIPHLAKSSTSTVNACLRCSSVSISIQSLENSLKNSNIQFCKVHRLVYSDTRKPMPIVRVTFDNHESYETAIESDGVLIPGFKKSIKFCPERKHRVIRCYNCNRFGHISRPCPYNHSCANCGGEECGAFDCNKAPICSNCGQGHKADSSRCPIFIRLKKKSGYFQSFVINSPNNMKFLLLNA